RGTRRKDLRGGPGAGGTAGGRLRSTVSGVGSGEAPLLGGWQRVGGQSGDRRGGPGRDFDRSHENHLGSMSGSYNGTESRYGFRRIDSYSSRIRVGSHNWSFVFDPAGRLCYYWSMVVSLAFLYNFWVIIYRFAFREIDSNTIVVWFCLDYFADFLYLVDILFHFRTGYLEDGVLQTDSGKLRQHYMNSTTFYIDCLCLLPLDFLYLSIGTERHTNYPNLFRSSSLIHYLLVIFHWNGCLFHIILKNDGFGSKNWVYSDSDSTDYVKAYLQSYYWCTLALTTIGDLPRPRNKGEYLFVIFQLLFGLLLFATVLGHVANIVTSVSTARKEFQAKLDGVKTYMRMRRVPNHLQVKVIKWFDYLWLTQKCSDEEKAVSCLPDKLKAEIAINVHLDTLKRVEIFQNTEAGFLCELVLRLRPVLFSPGDYICRKGEVGKEMYIVNRGRLQVVADNGRTVLATLKAGSYFGEISILNMGTAAAMGRSQSTPGLVESRGRITLEDMWVPPYPPAILMQPQSLQPQSLLQQGPPPPSAAVTPDSPGTMLQCDSMTQLMSGVTTPILGSHDVLESEIKRLRERLHTVEAENAAMSVKLHQQQWELEHRLAEIELQICRSGATSRAGGIDGRSRSSSSVAGEEEEEILNEEEEPEDDERNRESII
ncbi:unnamed protein product, partial [Callosobruchus maculatus]